MSGVEGGATSIGDARRILEQRCMRQGLLSANQAEFGKKEKEQDGKMSDINEGNRQGSSEQFQAEGLF